MKEPALRVAIIQRFCPHYRVPLFNQISQIEDIELTVIVNDSKTLSWKKKELDFDLVYLPALIAKFGFGAKNYQIPLSLALVN